MSTLKIVPCGTQVILIPTGVKGVISEALIKFSTVSYRIVYFNNGDFKDIWATAEEFTAEKHKKKQIGFI